MKLLRSIAFRLSAVFFFFFLLVIVLGLFSIGQLTDFNRVSADIRDRWLPNTRLLGDLNNFTSDFRAAEGRNLLSSSPAGIADSEQEMQTLDAAIERAQNGYERIRQDPAEQALYAKFKAQWAEYRKIVDHVVNLSPTDRKSEAIKLYGTTSRTAYDGASDLLGQLTDRNVAAAAAAGERADLAYQQARWLIRVAMLFAGLMGAGALFYVRGAIFRPLSHLAGCMHRLAANQTSVEVPGTDRRDEIGEMARAVRVFRNNAIELILSQRGLEQQASMLEERLVHEQRLTQLQRNFVTMASHEFRTPLTVIDAHAQRLIRMRDRLRPEEIGERAGKLRSAVLRMTSVMDNLLNSSRLVDERAELYFHPAELDLASLLHEVCQLHREIAPASQIDEFYGNDPLQIVGDTKLLFQVFSNLISNAVKYSPRGGLITVRARVDAQHAVVSVEDQGIGVPKEDIEHLFVRHHRGANVSGIVGTGVGLYLVKMVLDLHHGEIAVDSREGEGSRFIMRLPVKLTAQTAAPARPAKAAEPPRDTAEPVTSDADAG